MEEIDQPILTDQEFVAVSKTFFSRLSEAMSNAGCNDVFEDEFPKSVCDKFNSDFALFDAWKKCFYTKSATLKIKGGEFTSSSPVELGAKAMVPCLECGSEAVPICSSCLGKLLGAFVKHARESKGCKPHLAGKEVK